MRERLPNRRASESFAFIWNGMDFTATVLRFSDGRLAEIFLTNGKTDIDAASRVSAVISSLALQNGAAVQTIRHALMRDEHRAAISPLGVALDLLN